MAKYSSWASGIDWRAKEKL